MIDTFSIRQVLQKEYDRHNIELTNHKELIEKNDSKKQKRKFWKHFHKRWEVERIAEMLNIKLKEIKIDYNKIWEEYQKDMEEIKKLHIKLLEQDINVIRDIYSRKVHMRGK